MPSKRCSERFRSSPVERIIHAICPTCSLLSYHHPFHRQHRCVLPLLASWQCHLLTRARRRAFSIHLPHPKDSDGAARTQRRIRLPLRGLVARDSHEGVHLCLGQFRGAHNFHHGWRGRQQRSIPHRRLRHFLQPIRRMVRFAMGGRWQMIFPTPRMLASALNE